MKLLTPILFLAASVSIFYWFINPVYKDIGTLRAQGKEYDAAIARVERATEKRDDLLEKFNSISQNDRQRLQKTIPDSVDNIRLVVDINAIAGKYGTSIKNIKLAENTPSGNLDQSADIKAFGSLALSFSTSMSYDNFLRFITDLQQNLRLSDIIGIDFTSENSGIYNYTITLKTYVMR